MCDECTWHKRSLIIFKQKLLVRDMHEMKGIYASLVFWDADVLLTAQDHFKIKGNDHGRTTHIKEKAL